MSCFGVCVCVVACRVVFAVCCGVLSCLVLSCLGLSCLALCLWHVVLCCVVMRCVALCCGLLVGMSCFVAACCISFLLLFHVVTIVLVLARIIGPFVLLLFLLF